MNKINLIGEKQEIIQGVNQIKKYLNFELSPNGIPIKVIREKGPLKVNKKTGENYISFYKPAHFFRGLNIFLNLESEGYIEETPNFDEMGVMFDVSRNAVLSMQGFQLLINKLASLGINSAMLYMEDMYEVDNYPYFGYMRGRYSKKELVKMDEYADSLGIELIPCIQTLSHLHEPLKWSFADDLKDTNQTLLVGEEKTYEFLQSAIKSVSECFKTNKIHIGMDEALDLGTGNYFLKHGYQERFQILLTHLKMVNDITVKLGLSPMMWSDMFLRLGSKSGYYYDEEAKIPTEIVSEIPNIELMYWDYYNNKEKTYNKIWEIHKTLNKPLSFAGGIWLFNGIAPNYGRTISTTNAALLSCKKNKIKKVYATIWFDDGAETPIETCFPGLQLFAEHQFYKDPSIDHVKSQFCLLQNEKFDDYMLFDLFDQVKGVLKGNPYSSAMSKIVLYQDLLLGLYDKNVEKLDLKNHYAELSNRLEQVTTQQSSTLFRYYSQLSEILSIKANLGIEIKENYDLKNKKAMKDSVENIIKLIDKVKLLQKLHAELWCKYNKTIGLEVLEIRYGGIINRMHFVSLMLLEWIDNMTDIDDLEVSRLVYDDVNTAFPGTSGRNFYQAIATPNILSVFR